VKITIPYTPRPLQRLIHKSLKRFNVLVCHRRFGKTIFCINEIIRKAMCNTKTRPQYAYIAPTIKQAKKVAWDALKGYTNAIPGVKYNESELTCTLPNKAKIYILGAENYDSIRGMYLDGAVMDEVAQMSPAVWGQVVRPALADRKGWGIFIGTPQGQNYFYEIYEKARQLDNWFTKVYRSSETGILPGSELSDLKDELTEEEYEQEMECSFTAAVKGTYYGKLMTDMEKDGRIKNIAWEPMEKVFTAWDLGLNDKTVIWFFQNIVGEIRVIDYYENSDQDLTHYVNVIQSKKYVYDTHIMPHDVTHRSYQTGKSSLEQFKRLGLRCKVAARLSIKEGISAVKSILPKCYFDEDRCHEGLIALRNYRSEYNDRLGIFSDTPRHDRYSHAADAFRYLALGIGRSTSVARRRYQQYQMSASQEIYDPFNF